MEETKPSIFDQDEGWHPFLSSKKNKLRRFFSQLFLFKFVLRTSSAELFSFHIISNKTNEGFHISEDLRLDAVYFRLEMISGFFNYLLSKSTICINMCIS